MVTNDIPKGAAENIKILVIIMLTIPFNGKRFKTEDDVINKLVSYIEAMNGGNVVDFSDIKWMKHKVTEFQAKPWINIPVDREWIKWLLNLSVKNFGYELSENPETFGKTLESLDREAMNKTIMSYMLR